MVIVIFATLVDIVDESLDAQSLQNVSEVLLQGLLAVLVSKQDASFCLSRLASAQLVFVEHASRQVCGLGVVQIQDVLHVGARVEVLNYDGLSLHHQVFNVEKFAAKGLHRLKCDITTDQHVRLFTRLRVPLRSILALLTNQIQQFTRLLRYDNQGHHHDQAIEYLGVIRCRVDVTITHSSHSDHTEVDGLNIVDLERAILNVRFNAHLVHVGVHDRTVDARGTGICQRVELVLVAVGVFTASATSLL